MEDELSFRRGTADETGRAAKHVQRVEDAAKETFAIVLAGGRGSRLQELTDWRAKPAVAFAGKFRIIDFALSNCVNSGIRRIGVATQYKAQSLIGHIQRGWSFLDGRLKEFIELLPAQQRISAAWYLGTADAVYQNLDILFQHSPRYVLILSGDQVYKMDYRRILRDHMYRSADVTVGCVEVPLDDARAFGVMSVDGESRVTAFEEKPSAPNPMPGRRDRALASMGIYIFSAPFLYEQLRRDARDDASSHDFGKDVIPRLVRDGHGIYAHSFAASCVDGGSIPYWRDVGTIDAFWEANIELTSAVPQLNLYDEVWPIWTYQEQLPPAKFIFDEAGRSGTAIDSLVSGGCIVSGGTVARSLLFSNVTVGGGSLVEDSVVLPNVAIGSDVVIRRAVIDKRCRVPDGMRIGVDPELDRKCFHVTDEGIVLVVPAHLGQETRGPR